MADGLKFPKTPKKHKPKLTPAKVQPIFNAAIVRRDGFCITSCGVDNLQCSHFFAVGGSGALRFHPANAHAQTAGEHIRFHNRDCTAYAEYMADHPKYEYLKAARSRQVKYSQDDLRRILELSKADRLDELEEFVEELIGMGT